VLVLGDVMLDEFVWGDVTRISPEAPVPVVDVRASRASRRRCERAREPRRARRARIGVGVSVKMRPASVAN
jgi:hypothetical protein